MVEPLAWVIVGLFAIGMGFSFLSADPNSPTSRWLSLFFGVLGLICLMNIGVDSQAFGLSRLWWIQMFSVAEIVLVASGIEWVLRVGRTAGGDTAGSHSERSLRVAQGLAIFYGLTGALFPTLRDENWNAAWTGELLRHAPYYLFAVPFFLALLLAAARIIRLGRQKPDRAEQLRLIALALATPFWCAGLVLPDPWRPVSFAIGLVIFLRGAIRYHVLQGQRGQFLGQFVSPQVAHLVRERGLASMMPQSRVELSVVSCDLRGFTAFTETAAPEEIMRLLDDYYGAVGEAVTEFGGSIKDFAGDGILALVGAPISYTDHAQRALKISMAIRARTSTIFSHWRALGLELGLGVGVASGFVTVGVISGTQRLEYSAVGPAVNLAARLCSRAEDGQILADSRVVGSVGDTALEARFEQLETAELKGFARPVSIFAVIPAAAPLQSSGPR